MLRSVLQCVLPFILPCVVSEVLVSGGVALFRLLCLLINVLQMCCSVLQCVAVCCSVLKCVAVCCSVGWCSFGSFVVSINACVRCVAACTASCVARVLPFVFR